MKIFMNDTLFYDGNCSLCAAEIKHLKRWKDEKLYLQNIHSMSAQTLTELGVDKESLLSLLHLRTSEGRLMVGLDATVQAWKHTKFGWIVAPLRWPIIKQVADLIYIKWANKRACDLGYVCKPN